jgi:hypothetical protein
MPGASEQTSQVKVLNVNWTAGADAEDGRFEVMILTADGEKHLRAQPSLADRCWFWPRPTSSCYGILPSGP